MGSEMCIRDRDRRDDRRSAEKEESDRNGKKEGSVEKAPVEKSMKKIEEPAPVSCCQIVFSFNIMMMMHTLLFAGGCGGKQVCLPAGGGWSGQRGGARGLDGSSCILQEMRILLLPAADILKYPQCQLQTVFVPK